MDETQALLALAALAQNTRLGVFRLLVAQEPEGLAAGDIARRLAIPHNTLSSHLGVLTRAGLVKSQRRSRSVVYRAELETMQALGAFLVQDCCGGRPDICTPQLTHLAPCCSPARGTTGAESLGKAPSI